MAGKVDDVQGRMLVFCATADGWYQLKQSDQCDRVLATALAFAKAVADPKKRAVAIAEVGLTQADVDQRSAATKTFELALDAAGTIDKPFFRAYALGDVAQRLSSAGFYEKAHEVFNRAERAAEDVPEQDLQTQSLERVRSLMGKLPKGEGSN